MLIVLVALAALSTAEAHVATRLFNFIDVDGDAVVTSVEVTAALRASEVSWAESPEFLSLLFHIFEMDSHLGLSLLEFQTAFDHNAVDPGHPEVFEALAVVFNHLNDKCSGLACVRGICLLRPEPHCHCEDGFHGVSCHMSSDQADGELLPTVEAPFENDHDPPIPTAQPTEPPVADTTLEPTFPVAQSEAPSTTPSRSTTMTKGASSTFAVTQVTALASSTEAETTSTAGSAPDSSVPPTASLSSSSTFSSSALSTITTTAPSTAAPQSDSSSSVSLTSASSTTSPDFVTSSIGSESTGSYSEIDPTAEEPELGTQTQPAEASEGSLSTLSATIESTMEIEVTQPNDIEHPTILPETTTLAPTTAVPTTTGMTTTESTTAQTTSVSMPSTWTFGVVPELILFELPQNIPAAPRPFISTTGKPSRSCDSVVCSNLTCHWDSICFEGNCFLGPALDDGTPCALHDFTMGSCLNGTCHAVMSNASSVQSADPCLDLVCPPLDVCQLPGICVEGVCLSGGPVADFKSCGFSGHCVGGTCVEVINLEIDSLPCSNMSCNATDQCLIAGICHKGLCFSGAHKDDATPCLAEGQAPGTCVSGSCVALKHNLCTSDPCVNGECIQVSEDSFECICLLYYEGPRCERLSDPPGWQDAVVVGYNGVVTNLSILNPAIVSERDRNPWSICPQHACRFLFQDGHCDPLCNTADCLWDGNDCVSSQPCPDLALCRESLRDGVCDSECHNRACFWDAIDCNTPAHATIDNSFQVFFAVSLSEYLSSRPWSQISFSKYLNVFVNVINATSTREIGSEPSFGTVVTYSIDSYCMSSRCFPSMDDVVTFINALIAADDLPRSLGPAGANRPEPPLPVEQPTSNIYLPVAAIVAFIGVTFLGAAVAVVKRKRHRIHNGTPKGSELDSSEYSHSNYSETIFDSDQNREALENIRKIFKASSEEDFRGSNLSLNGIGFQNIDTSVLVDEIIWNPPSDIVESDQPQQEALLDMPTSPRLSEDFEWEGDFHWDKLLDTRAQELLAEDAMNPDLFVDLSQAHPTASVAVDELEMPTVSLPVDEIAICDEQGNTSLLRAAMQGNVDDLRPLILRRANIHHANAAGDTVLHIACRGNSANVVHYLASLGAKLNARNKQGLTPVHVAVSSNNLEAVHVLLQLQADLNLPDLTRSTPLMTALKLHHEHAALLLMAPSLKVNQTDTRGWTALHWASAVGMCNLLQFLVGLGAHVNAASKKGEMPLHLAAKEGNAECILELLRLGAKRLVADDLGNTPLDLATQRGFNVVTAALAEPRPEHTTSPGSTSSSSAVASTVAPAQPEETKQKKSKHIAKAKALPALKQSGLTMLQMRMQKVAETSGKDSTSPASASSQSSMEPQSLLGAMSTC